MMRAWASEIRQLAVPTLVFLLVFHVVIFGFQFFGDDSPAFGIVLLPFIFLFLAVWLAAAIVNGARQGVFAGLSWFVAPMLATVVILLFARLSFPPERMWFEVLRPYYLVRLLMAPATEPQRTEFVWVNREQWAGHEKLSIIYEPRRDISDVRSAGDTFVHVIDMGQGFFMVRRSTQY
jgi:hypothetical protein